MPRPIESMKLLVLGTATLFGFLSSSASTYFLFANAMEVTLQQDGTVGGDSAGTMKTTVDLAEVGAETETEEVRETCRVNESGDVVCTPVGGGEEYVKSKEEIQELFESLVKDRKEGTEKDASDSAAADSDSSSSSSSSSTNANTSTTQEPQKSCENDHDSCNFWASQGECEKNPDYMLSSCAKSCNNCDGSVIQAKVIEQQKERDSLLAKVSKYGVSQKVDGMEENQTMFVIRKTIDYMENFLMVNDDQGDDDDQDKDENDAMVKTKTHKLTQQDIDKCVNREELCSFWSGAGECEKNPSFMALNCSPACQVCGKRSEAIAKSGSWKLVDPEDEDNDKDTNPEKKVITITDDYDYDAKEKEDVVN